MAAGLELERLHKIRWRGNNGKEGFETLTRDRTQSPDNTGVERGKGKDTPQNPSISPIDASQRESVGKE